MRLSKTAIDLFRARQCMEMRQLASKASVSEMSIRNGYKQGITPVTIGKIAKALGVDPEEIILKEE